MLLSLLELILNILIYVKNLNEVYCYCWKIGHTTYVLQFGGKREREAKCLKLRTVKTISTLIRILEIISFASYYKTFLMCSQNPLLLYYSSTQQHSTPQFKAQLSNNTQMVYISGSNKIVSPFCLEKVRKQVETWTEKEAYTMLCCVWRPKKPTKQTFRRHIALNSVQKL